MLNKNVFMFIKGLVLIVSFITSVELMISNALVIKERLTKKDYYDRNNEEAEHNKIVNDKITEEVI
ncbi:MAG: hypothetical protein IJ880_00625 [Bacilli bacterium]|nr:hypothetical protein [Bacilli bacterium]